jgi:hypothetical protein
MPLALEVPAPGLQFCLVEAAAKGLEVDTHVGFGRLGGQEEGKV